MKLKHYILCTKGGEITETGSVQEKAFERIAAEALKSDEYAHQIDAPLADPDRFYWSNGLKERPASPGEWAEFDAASATWREVSDAGLIDSIRERCLARVSAAAASARLRWTTGAFGQEAIYREKRREAEEYIADPQRSLDTLPFMASEVGITADRPDELAQIWLNLNHQWRIAMASIESTRMKAKIAISTTQSPRSMLEKTENAVADLQIT